MAVETRPELWLEPHSSVTACGVHESSSQVLLARRDIVYLVGGEVGER